MERLLGMLAVLALAALAVVGCGGDERVAYERDLAKVGRVVDSSLEELPSGGSETIGADEVSGLATDLREAADDLHDLDPPEGAAAAQKRLERGLRGVADAFSDLSDDLRKARTDADKADLFVEFATDERVDKAFDDVIGAQEAYAAHGYRVFGTKRAVKTTADAAGDAAAGSAGG